ncbi:MAG TPA: YtxH domain-containing protein, partial [Longimicrobium sp.]
MADYDDDLPTFVIETHGGGGAGTFLLGALVGAAVALLLAPRSGAETQAEIAGAARRLRSDVEGRVTGARDRVAGGVDRTRERVSETFGSVRGEV